MTWDVECPTCGSMVPETNAGLIAAESAARAQSEEVERLKARVAELEAIRAREADRLGYARKFTPAEIEIAQLRARVAELESVASGGVFVASEEEET